MRRVEGADEEGRASPPRPASARGLTEATGGWERARDAPVAIKKDQKAREPEQPRARREAKGILCAVRTSLKVERTKLGRRLVIKNF